MRAQSKLTKWASLHLLILQTVRALNLLVKVSLLRHLQVERQLLLIRLKVVLANCCRAHLKVQMSM